MSAFWGVKRTLILKAFTSAFDPYQTFNCSRDRSNVSIFNEIDVDQCVSEETLDFSIRHAFRLAASYGHDSECVSLS